MENPSTSGSNTNRQTAPDNIKVTKKNGADDTLQIGLSKDLKRYWVNKQR